MSEIFEVDPISGITTYMDTHWDKTGMQVTLRREGDCAPVLDFAKARANEVGKDTAGIRKGWWLYAKLPPIIIVMMRQKGINIFDRTHQKRMFAEINEHYPHLKCVDAVEGATHTKQIFLG